MLEQNNNTKIRLKIYNGSNNNKCCAPSSKQRSFTYISDLPPSQRVQKPGKWDEAFWAFWTIDRSFQNLSLWIEINILILIRRLCCKTSFITLHSLGCLWCTENDAEVFWWRSLGMCITAGVSKVHLITGFENGLYYWRANPVASES